MRGETKKRCKERLRRERRCGRFACSEADYVVWQWFTRTIYECCRRSEAETKVVSVQCFRIRSAETVWESTHDTGWAVGHANQWVRLTSQRSTERTWRNVKDMWLLIMIRQIIKQTQMLDTMTKYLWKLFIKDTSDANQHVHAVIRYAPRFMTKLSVDAYCVAYVTLEDTCSQMRSWIVFFHRFSSRSDSELVRSQKCLSLVYTIPIRFHLLMTWIQHISEPQRTWNIVVCTWSWRKTAFMTRFDVEKSILTESLPSRSRRESDASLEASMSAEEDWRDLPSWQVSSTIQRRSVVTWGVQDLAELRTYFENRSPSSKFEIRYYPHHKKLHLVEKKSNSDGCAEMCGERGRRERWPTSHFEDRNSKSKLDVWSSRLAFMKVRKTPSQNDTLSPLPLPSLPFSVFLPSPSLPQVRRRARMWGRGGWKGRRRRRDPEVPLRTSNFELWNLQLPTSPTPSWTRSQRLQITRAIVTRLNESHRDEKLFQVNTVIYPLIIVSTWNNEFSVTNDGYILSRGLYIFYLSCPPVENYSSEQKCLVISSSTTSVPVSFDTHVRLMRRIYIYIYIYVVTFWECFRFECQFLFSLISAFTWTVDTFFNRHLNSRGLHMKLLGYPAHDPNTIESNIS